MLGFCCKRADRHVFDHATEQRADDLIGHLGCFCLERGCRTPRSQDRRPRRAIFLAPPPAPAPYLASGLVHWPFPDVAQWTIVRPSKPRACDDRGSGSAPNMPPPKSRIGRSARAIP
jgi:hypothetical protein